jgi:hypothetical protein
MKFIIFVILAVTVSSCKKAEETTYSVDTTEELAQHVGDTMVSLDESGGSSSGSLAALNTTGFEKTFVRLNKDYESFHFENWVWPKAYAAQCGSMTFSTCSSGVRTKDFADCTLGLSSTMTGTITLNFTGSQTATCAIPLANDAVSRVPNFTMTGLRGATFTVKAVSTGQTVTRVDSTHFNFSNTGITRTFTTPKGEKILDVTASTSSPISVTGTSRNMRTMSGGGITIVNNLTSVSCTMTPTSVAWTSGCNCPTTGSWSGTCTDSTSMSVTFGSTCGEATVVKGTESKTVTMDRCL